MNDICLGTMFDLIEKYKQKLIEATNIVASPEEMEVLDNILFRFWQMGWLDRLETLVPQSERKKGKWVKNPNSEYAPPVCSECGHECAFVVDYIEGGQGARQDIKRYLSNFCPNCGADMRGRTNGRDDN